MIPFFLQRWIVTQVVKTAAKKLITQGGRMKGFKTVSVNLIAGVGAMLAHFGFEVSPEVLTWVFGAAVPSLNILLRKFTSTPIFKAE